MTFLDNKKKVPITDHSDSHDCNVEGSYNLCRKEGVIQLHEIKKSSAKQFTMTKLEKNIKKLKKLCALMFKEGNTYQKDVQL